MITNQGYIQGELNERRVWEGLN